MRPRLKPFLTVARPAERVLTLQGGGLRLYFEGASVPALAELLSRLDGSPLGKDDEEMVAALAKRGVLDDLEADEPGEDTPLSRALSVFTATPRAALRRLQSARVLVAGEGLAARAARGILAESGARAVDAGPAEFTILAQDAPSAGPTETAIPSSTRVTLDGASAWVGPTHVPGHACHECLRARIRGQAARAETLDAHERALAERPPAPAALPALAHQAAALAAQEAVFALSGARPPALLDRAVEVTLAEGTRVHPVLPVVGCPACGGPRVAP